MRGYLYHNQAYCIITWQPSIESIPLSQSGFMYYNMTTLSGMYYNITTLHCEDTPITIRLSVLKHDNPPLRGYPLWSTSGFLYYNMTTLHWEGTPYHNQAFCIIIWHLHPPIEREGTPYHNQAFCIITWQPSIERVPLSQSGFLYYNMTTLHWEGTPITIRLSVL